MIEWNLQVPITLDPREVERQDPMTLQQWFNRIAELQDLHNSDPEKYRELTPEECRFAIMLTRILRRTNTGPARAKTSKPRAPSKKAATADFLADFASSLTKD